MSGEQGDPRRVLVACLGNPDRGDDGIGAAVARALGGRLPDGAALVVRRGGLLGLLDDWAGCDAVVCVDAAAPGGAPGALRRIDVVAGTLPADMALTSGHAFGLAEAVALAHALGLAPAAIVVYAVEGAYFAEGAAMTAEVAAAVPEVARRVLAEVRRLQRSAAALSAEA